MFASYNSDLDVCIARINHIKAMKSFSQSRELYEFLDKKYRYYTTTRVLTARREIVWFLLCCPKILPMDVTKIIFEKIKK